MVTVRGKVRSVISRNEGTGWRITVSSGPRLFCLSRGGGSAVRYVIFLRPALGVKLPFQPVEKTKDGCGPTPARDLTA